MSLDKRHKDLIGSIQQGLNAEKNPTGGHALFGNRAPIRPPQRTEGDGKMPPTAVGSMVGDANRTVRQERDEALQKLAVVQDEVGTLSSELDTLRQGETLLRIEPSDVLRGPYADRHETAFAGPEFEAFSKLIAESGGNRQPGQVRPLGHGKYELVSGHRRHAACLKLGLPFLAWSKALNDQQAVLEMHAENSGRKNLSAFERGMKFHKIISSGLFSNIREAALQLNEPFQTFGRLVRYGDLPKSVVDLFPDPREIQASWVAPLLDKAKTDKPGLAKQITQVKARNIKVAKQIYAVLTSTEDTAQIVTVGGKVVARVRTVNSSPAVILRKDAPAELVAMLVEQVRDWETRHAKEDGE